jgi:hypothetical protein
MFKRSSGQSQQQAVIVCQRFGFMVNFYINVATLNKRRGRGLSLYRQNNHGIIKEYYALEQYSFTRS